MLGRGNEADQRFFHPLYNYLEDRVDELTKRRISQFRSVEAMQSAVEHEFLNTYPIELIQSMSETEFEQLHIEIMGSQFRHLATACQRMFQREDCVSQVYEAYLMTMYFNLEKIDEPNTYQQSILDSLERQVEIAQEGVKKFPDDMEVRLYAAHVQYEAIKHFDMNEDPALCYNTGSWSAEHFEFVLKTDPVFAAQWNIPQYLAALDQYTEHVWQKLEFESTETDT